MSPDQLRGTKDEVMGHRRGREFASDYDRPINIRVNFGGAGGGTFPAREAEVVFKVPRKAHEELPPGPDSS